MTTTAPTYSPNTPQYDHLQLLLLGHFSLQNGGGPEDFRQLHPAAVEQDCYDATVASHDVDPLADRDARRRRALLRVAS